MVTARSHALPPHTDVIACINTTGSAIRDRAGKEIVGTGVLHAAVQFTLVFLSN